MKLLDMWLDSRFSSLLKKEIEQILRDKQMLFYLLFPPTVQLLLFGLALNPNVNDFKLGVIDYSNTPASRALVSTLTANTVFVRSYSFSEHTLEQQLQKGQIGAAIVIPPEFNRDLSQEHAAEIQVLIDGVDANTAGIVRSYIAQIVGQYNRQLSSSWVPALVETQAVFVYNPGLISSWFFVPGILGMVLTLISSLVSSATAVREKEIGTFEQLLMTPAAAWEILLAKVMPLFVLLMGDAVLGLSVARLVFGVPLRGNFLLFLALSALYIFVGMGIGIMLGSTARNQRQVQLTSFFMNLPLIQLSGALTPIESMPLLFQYLSLLNPLRHYVAILRGLLLKGVGLDVLWPNVLALVTFAVVLSIISINRFRISQSAL